MKSERLAAGALEPVKKYPIARFHPQDEIYHFRHWFSEPAPLAIDRMRYSLQYTTAAGVGRTAILTFPVTYYKTRTELIAPIKGNFIAIPGHEYYEVAHKYEWNQQFSYDFVGLGDNLELLKSPGSALEDKAAATA